MYRSGSKRLLDLVAAALALVLLAPVMLLIAILIRLADPGPAIFRQRRVGLNGAEFLFFKFRTMPSNTGDIPSDQLAEVRLSAVGRFLRRSNLDELPQLYNVLRGDMSLVGPRPPIPSQTELVELRRANGALQCRPGLTGWAQVNSYDGMSVPRKAELDGEYAARLSFAFDCRIVLRTFGYVMKPPPKY